MVFKELNNIANETKARETLLRRSDEPEGLSVRGVDFNHGVSYEKIVESFETTGFQATQLHKAIEITNKMISSGAFIFLGYTSNMVSSGLRDVISYLVQHKKINVLVTTCGGIEEDIIKCLGSFKIGNFDADGASLRERGINRIGNIFVPNSRYVKFEKFVQPILEELYQMALKRGKPVTGNELIWKLGEKIKDENSIYYWAWKNQIPVYCPALLDGALGDNIYFFKFKRPDFVIDCTEDVVWFNNTTIGLEKSGAIILGAGVVKHAILNANMLRNGLDYAVYINTSQEFDGSDAGALPSEAVSWGKILPNALSVKVFVDATIVFPLLVAESFGKK
ncbi:MAG: Deoxyhypusine synthase [Parcubacteria group bacterium GW2011_GWA1_36_12]|nr:MAG: Deoxyhypusine synthase [Parcubacteria group bacterium GW2011_GWA1_36_12]